MEKENLGSAILLTGGYHTPNLKELLRKENISYAVHAAIVEVRLVNRIFAATLGTFKPLATVFRMGYVKDLEIKESRPHSPRLPIASVLLSEKPD